MSEFLKYIHLERYGTTEVEGVELGECWIFPKLDGTNASVWWDSRGGPHELKGCVACGSRNRQLSAEKDNAGFWAFINSALGEEYRRLVSDCPNLILYGEWLVPHTLKTYRADAWNKFYVFDVYDKNLGRFLSYREYANLDEEYNIEILPRLCKIRNPSYEQLLHIMKSNTHLIEDGKGIGEGIVIKNYGFQNRFGRTVWAKMVNNEFKEQHRDTMGAAELKGPDMVEEKIVEKYVTEALVRKEKAKIENEVGGWASKLIPRLLGTVYHCLVVEESWNFVKEFKNPSVNFKTLQHLTNNKIKQLLPEVFS